MGYGRSEETKKSETQLRRYAVPKVDQWNRSIQNGLFSTLIDIFKDEAHGLRLPN
jgi:hypothetical protein